MDRSRPAAERVRPILEAMERSIDAARRRRTHTGTPPAAPARPAIHRDPAPTGGGTDAPQRLKARPKRNVGLSYQDRPFRSQAG